MPLWQWVLDIVGALLLLVLLYGVALVVRRRWIARDGGTFELSYRVRSDRAGRGWVLGVGRYSGDLLEFFRIFSVLPRPMRTLDRADLVLRRPAALVGRRGARPVRRARDHRPADACRAGRAGAVAGGAHRLPGLAGGGAPGPGSALALSDRPACGSHGGPAADGATMGDGTGAEARRPEEPHGHVHPRRGTRPSLRPDLSRGPGPRRAVRRGLPRLADERWPPDAVMVLGRIEEGPRVLAVDGAELAPGEIEVDLSARSGGRVGRAERSRRRWASAGVRRVVARALPAASEVLLVAWGDQRPPTRLRRSAARSCSSRPWHGWTPRRGSPTWSARVDSAQQLANMGDYDWHISTDTNRWSDQLYRIYGHEPGSFNASYERFLSLIHPDDRERISGVHQQAYATGEPYQMIERIVRPDGRPATSPPTDRCDGRARHSGPDAGDLHRHHRPGAGRAGARAQRGAVPRTGGGIARRHRGARRRPAGWCRPTPVRPSWSAASWSARCSTPSCPVGRWRRAERRSPATGVDGQDADPRHRGGGARRACTTNACGRCSCTTPARGCEGEAIAAGFRESQVRRRQALEINDNIVQGSDRGDLLVGRRPGRGLRRPTWRRPSPPHAG